MFAFRVSSAMTIYFFTCLAPRFCSETVDPSLCRHTHDGGGCPKSGAAMLQRAAHKRSLQRVDAEALRTPMQRSKVMSDQERQAVRARAVTMGKQAVAVQTMLRRAMNAVNGTPGAQNELDQLIVNLIGGQTTSEDKCPAQLLEAKHQLNQLHKHMYAVAYEINHTSLEVKSVSKEVAALDVQWTQKKGECNQDQEKCSTETESYKKQWEILKWELIEMQQIANPSYTITASDMSYAAYQSREESEESKTSYRNHSWNNTTTESKNPWMIKGVDDNSGMPEYDGFGATPEWWPVLLQATAGRDEPVSMSVAQAVSSMVKSTRSSAQDLQHCFQFWSAQGGGAGPMAASLMGQTRKGVPDDRYLNGAAGNEKNGNNWTKNITKSDDGNYENSEGGETDGFGRGKTNLSAENSEESVSHDWTNVLTNDSSSSDISDACKKQLVAFEKTYYKAYRQVVRLISKYEVLMNGTSCSDRVEEGCQEQDNSFSGTMRRETEKLEELTETMTHTKGHITVTSNQEKSLTTHIQLLSDACASLDATVSDLDKVRDAIQIFGVCAGLARPNFHIPIYGGTVTVKVTLGMSDVDIDAAFNYACHNSETLTNQPVTHVARAAETSEIMQQAIEGMPNKLSNVEVLMGTCPHCVGDTIDSTQFRTCWDPDKELDGVTMRSDCSRHSLKRVMCVFDRFDTITDAAGENRSGIKSIASYSYSYYSSPSVSKTSSYGSSSEKVGAHK